MADEEYEGNEEPREDPSGEDAPQPEPDAPRAVFRMELVDSLPGDRAVVGVEQEGEFMWLASKKHVTQQAVEEFTDQLTRIVSEGWWVQNWPGARG
ncbi:hypothetical protein G9272_32365 [Streptomyces asoensis]|uniref:Uncharacterized protein n=1 Tax=Streptomyces asoensis TaxID=249586 RepID=A0A6M4X8E9_9ACTN|nr:hypothetical protein [Streptomyces asoensis]QJT04413.1 hypothetical protein G9272_32365 [Streptomyces asoensis]